MGDTCLFNAGKQAGEAPTHIVIDFVAGIAKWVTADAVQECSL